MNLDINKLKNESGFTSYNQLANYLLSLFHESKSSEEMQQISQFAKDNNINIVKILSDGIELPFEQEKPKMSSAELKQAVEQIAEPEPLVKEPDEQIKKVLE